MKWWYENEEEEMGLEIMAYDKEKGWHYRPIKEKKMEFDKSRVYTALNADELKQGDKVITANCMADLKIWVQSNDNAREILLIHDDTNLARFEVKGSSSSYISALAYLVERAENCTNCRWRRCCIRQKPEHPELTKCCDYKRYECSEYEPKTEPNFKAALKETIKGFKECGVGDLIPNQNAEPRAKKPDLIS